MKLAIWGSGSLGIEILSLLRKEHKEKYSVYFVDDYSDKKIVHDVPVYRYNEFINMFSGEEVGFVIATGEPLYREKMMQRLFNDKMNLATIISCQAYIGERTIIEPGCVIFPNSYIGNDISIGHNCIILANTKVEPECVIGRDSFISSGAFIGANTEIGDMTFIGPNASIFDHISIGEKCIVGVGSVVINDLMNGIVVVGNPAREIRKNVEGRVFKTKNCKVD